MKCPTCPYELRSPLKEGDSYHCIICGWEGHICPKCGSEMMQGYLCSDMWFCMNEMCGHTEKVTR